MRNFLILLVLLLRASVAFSQIAIGTTTPSNNAQLDVNSTSKGVLIPRLTQTQINAISSPAAGLQVYNTTLNCISIFNGTSWTTEKRYIGQIVNEGVPIELDNLKIQIPNSGNHSIQIATKSGTANLSGSSTNNFNNSSVGGSGNIIAISTYHRQSDPFNTTFAYWQSGANFLQAGSYQEIWIVDETNNRAYHIKYIVGPSFQNNYLEIEQWL